MKSQNENTKPPRALGRWIVIIVIVIGLAAAVTAPWLRSASKPRHVAQLEESNAARVAAFYGLLKANLLWTYARNYVYDLRSDAYGEGYARHIGVGDKAQLVIRGTPERLDLPKHSQLFVFSADGTFETIYERAAAFVVEHREGDPPHHGTVVIIKVGEKPRTCELFLVDEDREQPARAIPTPFVLKLASTPSRRLLVEWPIDREEPLMDVAPADAPPTTEAPAYKYNTSTRTIEPVKKDRTDG